MPHDFISAITDRRLRLRPLKVIVKGRFRRNVPAPVGRVSHIEISKALSWKFVGEKTTQNLEERFLGQELLDLIYDPFAIGIAIRLDRYATSQSVKGGMPALHGFDRRFEVHGNGFDSQPVPQIERTRDLFVGAPTPQNLIPRFGGNTLKSVS